MYDYKVVDKHKLSPTQIRKILKGEKVRIKLHSGHELHHTIHVSPEQHHKLHKAHAQLKAYTIHFDPHQCEQHGAGVFGNIAKHLRNVVHKHKHLINPII